MYLFEIRNENEQWKETQVVDSSIKQIILPFLMK